VAEKLFIAVMILLCASSSSSEANPNHRAFVFASPNTRASLSDEDALRSISSFEQLNAIAVADRLACALTPKVQITDAVGVFSDSSENTLILEGNLRSDGADYLASLMGRYAHQEFVLAFVEDPDGRSTLWTLTTSLPVTTVLPALRNAKLLPGTVLQQASGTAIIFVDIGNSASNRVGSFASQLHSVASSIVGDATLIGDDDRTKSAGIFQRHIQADESRLQKHLSKYIWTPAFHDATQRTCSTNQPAF
jgi:hypothetical protein